MVLRKARRILSPFIRLVPRMFFIEPFARSAALTLALLAATPATAQDRPRDDLLTRWRCAVYDRLAQIHATPPTPYDRFLIIEMPAKPYAYVQCIFENGDTTMFCEVASGYFHDVPRNVWLPKPVVAAIGRLGYSTDDTKSNFAIEFPVPRQPDIGRIAEFMLTSLHVAYGADGGTDLAFKAPYAPRASGACTPSS